MLKTKEQCWLIVLERREALQDSEKQEAVWRDPGIKGRRLYNHEKPKTKQPPSSHPPIVAHISPQSLSDPLRAPQHPQCPKTSHSATHHPAVLQASSSHSDIKPHKRTFQHFNTYCILCPILLLCEYNFFLIIGALKFKKKSPGLRTTTVEDPSSSGTGEVMSLHPATTVHLTYDRSESSPSYLIICGLSFIEGLLTNYLYDR